MEELHHYSGKNIHYQTTQARFTVPREVMVSRSGSVVATVNIKVTPQNEGSKTINNPQFHVRNHQFDQVKGSLVVFPGSCAIRYLTRKPGISGGRFVTKRYASVSKLFALDVNCTNAN